MLNIRASLRVFAALTFVCILSVAVQAQATRTWVEGAGGDDINPCSRTAPCKTFAGAISKTATSGINFFASKTLNVENYTIIGNTAAATNGVGIKFSQTVSGANLNVKNTNIFKNRIGLFVGTGTTVRLGSSIITQNGTNFSNNGTILSFCDNKTDTNPIPGAVSTSCLK